MATYEEALIWFRDNNNREIAQACRKAASAYEQATGQKFIGTSNPDYSVLNDYGFNGSQYQQDLNKYAQALRENNYIANIKGGFIEIFNKETTAILNATHELQRIGSTSSLNLKTNYVTTPKKSEEAQTKYTVAVETRKEEAIKDASTKIEWGKSSDFGTMPGTVSGNSTQPFTGNILEEIENAEKGTDTVDTKISLGSVGDTVDGILKEATKDNRLTLPTSIQEALDKDSIKSILKDAENVLSNSTYSAREKVQEIIDKVTKKAESIDFSNISLDSLLNGVSIGSLEKLEEDILKNQLTWAATIDTIAQKVQEKFGDIGDKIDNLDEILQQKKAYILAYIQETFSNPEYMDQIKGKISDSVDNFLHAQLNLRIVDLNTQIDNGVSSVFKSVNNSVDRITKNIAAPIDKLAKYDIIRNLNDKIKGLVSIDKITASLSDTPFGKVLSPAVKKIFEAGQTSVLKIISSDKVKNVINGVKQKLTGFTTKLLEYKKFVQSRIQMLKDYVNELKKKALNVIKDYAKKIIGDIASKVAISAADALGGIGGGFGGGISF